MEFKKEIFIFRHGQSEANKNKIACGNLDSRFLKKVFYKQKIWQKNLI